MVYPGKKHKSYETPNHPWQDTRMAGEVELVKAYGLRNKREVWKAESILRKYRSDAMSLLAIVASSPDGELKGHAKVEADQILGRLIRYGILKPDSGVDDILGLKSENILERRLQTQVLRLGLARTIRQSRQFITHGHIAINGRRATVPSMLISKEDEMNIAYYGESPLTTESHPERPRRFPQESVRPGRRNAQRYQWVARRHTRQGHKAQARGLIKSRRGGHR